jgi:IclR family acetate operon transcriptional repressor
MGTHTTRSIVKAFDLIEVVCCLPRSSSLRDVAAEAGMSLATTHRILTTLKNLGAIHVAPDGGYELGRKLSELRTRDLVEASELKTLLEGRLDEASRALGMSTRLSTLDDQQMLCFVAGTDAQGDPSGSSRVVGGRFEAYLHAPGKLLLGQLGVGGLSDYLADAPLVGATAKTIVCPKRLSAELRQASVAGYAFEDEEFVAGEQAIAVPLSAPGEPILAALSASRRVSERRGFERALTALQGCAAAIAADLAGRPRGVGSVLWLADLVD